MDTELEAMLSEKRRHHDLPFDVHPLPSATLKDLRRALFEEEYLPAGYDDRVEIINPGGPYGEVTAETFGTPGLTDYRNPNLAEALRVLGFVQRFAAGIPIARRALAENGNPPPEFLVRPTFVMGTLRPAS